MDQSCHSVAIGRVWSPLATASVRLLEQCPVRDASIFMFFFIFVLRPFVQCMFAQFILMAKLDQMVLVFFSMCAFNLLVWVIHLSLTIVPFRKSCNDVAAKLAHYLGMIVLVSRFEVKADNLIQDRFVILTYLHLIFISTKMDF